MIVLVRLTCSLARLGGEAMLQAPTHNAWGDYEASHKSFAAVGNAHDGSDIEHKVASVLQFVDTDRHTLKNDAYASNFQPVNSDMRPFRDNMIMLCSACWGQPALDTSTI